MKNIKDKIKRNTNYGLINAGILDFEIVFDDFIELETDLLSKTEPTDNDLIKEGK